MEKTEVTCPKCRQPTELSMPSDRSVVIFECPNCRARSKALDGKCCVFCSYGTKHCPACTCNVENPGSQDSPPNLADPQGEKL